MQQSGLFGLTEHLERLSRHGDPLEVLEARVDFEFFRPWLVDGLGYGDGAKGGRPPFDPVSMFNALILQAQHDLSDARTEFMIRDRLSWMRFLGFIRESAVTAASAADGRQLRRLVSPENTGSEVWADTACRSQRNERWLADRMLTSRIHRRKPAGRPMPRNVARANAKKSAIRAAVEHVFAHQKTRFGLLIRTIGLARAEAKPTLANLAYKFDRLVFHERRRSMG